MQIYKLWPIGLVFMIALAGSAWLLRHDLGLALMRRGIEAHVGRDITTSLPDGLHIILCGTGSPLPDPVRAGPCSLVIAGTHLLVVDVGEGSARKLALMGIPLGRIDALFLTHFHSDHIEGLGPLLLQRWVGHAATAPLPIVGPTGVAQVVDGFNMAFALDNGYRTAHHGPVIAPPGGAGGVAAPFALPVPGQGDQAVVLDEDGVRVTAFRVNHGPVSPAVGYRFDYKGRSVVFSGDTSPSSSLIVAAKGADLLVHEALQPRLVRMMTNTLAAKGLANTAQITRDILTYHSTPTQAAETARAAGVKQLVLNHLVPPLPTALVYPAFLGDAHSYFSGPITIGEDGMMFSLPANGTGITQQMLLR